MIAYDDQHNEHVFPVRQCQSESRRYFIDQERRACSHGLQSAVGRSERKRIYLNRGKCAGGKKMNDKLIWRKHRGKRHRKAYVTAVGENTVISNILMLVKEAQAEKPPIQQLADKISAVFVPVVLGIALVTLIGNYVFTDAGLSTNLLRSIAVLVIACPCAMGLATPAAIAVGLGRAARNGVLFKNARAWRSLKT